MGDNLTSQGVWTTAQLQSAGHTHRHIARAVASGELIKIATGLYISKRDALTVLHAFARAYPGLTYTGRTAAHLYGASGMVWPAQAHHPTSRSMARYLDLRRRVERPTDRRHGLQVSVGAIVAADLAVDDQDAAVRVLEAVYCGYKGSRRLEEDCGQLTRAERKRLEPVLTKAVFGTASKLEETAVKIIKRALSEEIAAGLVTVEANKLFRGYWFDIMIKQARVLIEIDSYAFHGEGKAKRSAFIRDRHKGNQVTRWNWLLLRYPDHSVKHMPRYVGAEVADTVRFVLGHDRMRHEDEAIDSDRPTHDWYPEV
jgi:very-short-patch-repair endonuclease